MQFSSIPFLYYFLPCMLAAYFLVPARAKNGTLLAGSLLFYGWGEPEYLLVMALSVGQVYLFGRLIEANRENRKRSGLCLTASLLIGLGLLGWYKYADFFIAAFGRVTGLPVQLLGVTLPIGISFYTFQGISYVVDVYRGQVQAQRNIVDLALYIAMFPQLIAGPIVRYEDIAPQLVHRRWDTDQAAEGARRFVLGLGKKVLVANVLYGLMESFHQSEERTVLFCWLYAVACTLEIYFDFSGYSDMAIGLGLVLGFHLPENFRYPLIAGSVTEFWRRWHITLGSWFRDYVYIPLGGNRVSRLRWVRNLLLVWGLTGLWHGAAWSFVAWGLLFGVLLVGEKLAYGRLLQRTGALKYLYMLAVLPASFVLFDSGSLPDAWQTIRGMFGGGGLSPWGAESLYALKSYAGVLLLAAVGATPLPDQAVRKLSCGRLSGAVRWLEPVVLAALLLVCTGYLVDGSFNPFLYFRF